MLTIPSRIPHQAPPKPLEPVTEANPARWSLRPHGGNILALGGIIVRGLSNSAQPWEIAKPNAASHCGPLWNLMNQLCVRL